MSQAKTYINTTLAKDSKLQIQHGFQDLLTYISDAQKHKPAVIVLAMGMPKQEILAQQLKQELKQELKHPCLIICGGAILDFLAGRVTRSPLWMQKLGLERLYRLILEPKRLFKRYVNGNPLFLY